MAAGRGDLQRALHVLLALHVRKVRDGDLHRVQIRGLGRAEALLPAQMTHQLHHVFHRVDGQALGKGGLAGVFRRDIELFDPRLFRRQRHGQRPGHGPQLAGQRELAQKGRIFSRLPDLLRGGQIGHQDGQIVERAGFLPVRRRQVHGDAAGVKAEAVVADRGAHPFPGFLDRRVRQAHDVKGGHAVGDVELHRDGKAADAAHAEAVDLGKHRDSPLFQTKAPQGGSLDPRAGLFLVLLYSSTSPTTAMCSSSSCFCVTSEGAPIMMSWALLFIGKGMTSRMESSPARSMTMRSTPGAMPA